VTVSDRNEVPQRGTMTTYQLTQAIRRRKRFVAIAGFVVLLLALAAGFKLDGGLAWRSGQKWEASVQIAVVTPGNDSLAIAETRADYRNAAALYAGLLQSNEAAAAIGEANGFELDDPVTAVVANDSSLITATLIAPTEEQARSAALSIFDYLRDQLSRPLTPSGNQPTTEAVPTIELEGSFESALTMSLAPDLANLPEDLFLRTDSEVGSSLVLPIARSAGQEITVDTTLASVMTLVVTLEDATGAQLDTVRLAPPSVDGHSAYYPALMLSLDAGAIALGADSDGAETWEIREDGLDLTWQPGAPVSSEAGSSLVPVDIALVTADPAPAIIGGRRGPIILGVVILLGAVLILAVVVVAESWSRERQASIARSSSRLGDYDTMLEDPILELETWESIRADRESG
jgi:hypothetical protein